MLHTVNKSPFERNSLETCLRLAKAGSAVLLIEDAVYAAQKGTAKSTHIEGALGDHSVYVMGPDLKARGVTEDQIIDGVTVVDYEGFVDLTVENGTVNSWL